MELKGIAPIAIAEESTIFYLRNRSNAQNIVLLTAHAAGVLTVGTGNVYVQGYRSGNHSYYSSYDQNWYSNISSNETVDTDQYIMGFGASTTGLQSRIRPAIPSLAIFSELMNEYLIRNPAIEVMPAYNELYMRTSSDTNYNVAFVGDALQWMLDHNTNALPVPYFLKLDPAVVWYVKTHFPVTQTGPNQIAFDDLKGNRLGADAYPEHWTQVFIETTDGDWWYVGHGVGNLEEPNTVPMTFWIKADGLWKDCIYDGTRNVIDITYDVPTYNPCAGAVSEVAVSIAGALGLGGIVPTLAGQTDHNYSSAADLIAAGKDAFGTDLEVVVFGKSTPAPEPTPDIDLNGGYVYDGYRYVQFGVNIPSNTLLKLETSLSMANVEIKPLSRTGWLDPISDPTELAELLSYDTSSPIWQQQTENKRTIYGFRTDEPGVAVFQIKMPVGVAGSLYFGTMPTDELSNILIFNPTYNRIETNYTNVPAPTVSKPLVNVPQGDISTADGYYSILMYGPGEYLMPGTAIAFSKLGNWGGGNIGLVHPDVRLVDPKWVGLSGNTDLRNSLTKNYGCGSVWFGGDNFYANDTLQNLYRQVDFSTYPGLSGFQQRTGVIHRTTDNKLVLITYQMLNNEVAVNVEDQIVLVENLADIGFPPSLGMKFIINTINNGNSIFEITKPYTVTLDELLDFEPDITYEIDTDILVTDIYGTNVLMEP